MAGRSRNPFRLCIACLATMLALVGPAFGQTPEEHAQHHPAPAPAAPGTAAAMPPMPGAAPGGGAMSGNQSAGAEAGGMGAGMGEMMKQMGTPPPKEIYPTLMALPDGMTPEERVGIEQRADEEMKTGTTLLSSALERLTSATAAEDYAAMQEATTQMRAGLARFESGIAARRMLAEGNAPRNLALDWFKREMNLASPVRHDEPRGLFGVTPIHLFTMALLIGFALAMVAMYFFKMRRAAALFGRLGPDANAAPPGSAPPLKGSPGPSAPVPPPPDGAPPPAAAPPPAPPPPAVPPSPAIAGAAPEATSTSPMTANWRGQLRVGSIVTETPSVKTIRLLPSSSDRSLPFTFVPGQFLNVAFWIGGARMNRSYSISSSPTQRDYVEITVRREPRGAVSRHIDDLLKVGDKIEVGGPVGRFTFAGTEADSIVLISGGVGITPMMSIARYLTEQSWPGEIFFIYTCRVPTDFIFADALAALQRLNSKLHVAVTISQAEGTDWKGPRGHISKELLTQTVPNLASRRVHLCGPPPMMEALKTMLTELGVPPEQVKTELFGATKPAPAAAGAAAKPAAAATGPLVTFSKNNKSAKIRVDQTVLEFSEELGIGIENSCRVGTCGVCKVKMTSGEVEMAVEDALDPDDKANGIILACQAKPTNDIAVDA